MLMRVTPANYHYILIAGCGPQLQILSVGVRTVLKLQIIMAHLWESTGKRKNPKGDVLWRTRQAHTDTEENDPFLRQQNKQISVSITPLQCQQCF